MLKILFHKTAAICCKFTEPLKSRSVVVVFNLVQTRYYIVGLFFSSLFLIFWTKMFLMKNFLKLSLEKEIILELEIQSVIFLISSDFRGLASFSRLRITFFVCKDSGSVQAPIR